ncbi:MAG: FadR/GntR family transcriptional regulator [Saprospiraceae bacterium]
MINLNIKPTKSKKLANQLYEQILDWLISGMLKEGDKLPSENELCKSFQVSRPIVREAITKLKADELVYTRKGLGTFVKHSPLQHLARFASANDIANILQSHEVRMALESEAAALAAIRRTDKQLLKIKEALEVMRTDFDAQKLSIKADLDFHLSIAQASGNEIFAQLLENIDIGLKKTMAIGQSLSRESVKNNIAPTRNKEVLQEHQNILNAIELQDAETARLAMRYHISKIRERIINVQSSRL